MVSGEFKSQPHCALPHAVRPRVPIWFRTVGVSEPHAIPKAAVEGIALPSRTRSDYIILHTYQNWIS